jgi:2-methylcitrate dehydratase PrpD
MQQHEFTANDVLEMELACTDKVISHHDIRDPQDLMQAQYSVPFCLAMALHRDPLDPAVFNDSVLTDTGIKAACAAVRLVTGENLPTSWSARLRVVLKDGRELRRDAFAFKGMPGDEMTPQEERMRFELLCAALGPQKVAALYDRLYRLESEPAFPDSALMA